MKTIIFSHVKKGEKVQVISGTNKGIIGNITEIDRKKRKVIIDAISPRIKILKKSQEKQIPYKIHISNIMLWNSENKIRSRVGFKFLNKEKKKYFKKFGNII